MRMSYTRQDAEDAPRSRRVGFASPSEKKGCCNGIIVAALPTVRIPMAGHLHDAPIAISRILFGGLRAKG